MKVDPNKVLMEFLSFLVKGMPDAWMAHFSKSLKPVILIPLWCHFHLILSPKKSQIRCLYLGAKVENSNFKCFKTFLFVLNRREESSAFFGRHKIRNSKEVSCDKSFVDREFFQNLYHDFWCVLLQQLKETLVTSFASPQLHKLKVKIMSKFVLYHIFHISVKSFT